MRYTLRPTNRFRRDVKKAGRRGLDLKLLAEVIEKLASGVPLSPKHRDHALIGDYAGCRECHIQPDWLLIYEIEEENLYLYLTRTGSHSDLFS